MIDCYRVLGVSPHASQSDIRAAYIARMKRLHPDTRSAPDAAEADAGDISSAYWQLRTRDRRAEHDRHVLASTSLASADRSYGAPSKRLVPNVVRRTRPVRRRESASRMLVGAAMGILVLALAAPAGLFWLAQLNPIEPARATVMARPAASEADLRRPLDSAMRAAAADDFAAILRDFGLPGARTYSRQCLSELSARASMTMLDYCIAFDDAAANWERPKLAKEGGKSFFADAQRSGQYREIAEALREPDVRRAMMTEAGYFDRMAPLRAGTEAVVAQLSAL